MTFSGQAGNEPFRAYEGRIGTPYENERLRNIGELFTSISDLVTILHATHAADQIDYDLYFPLDPDAPVMIPSVARQQFSAEPFEVKVTAGYVKPVDASEPHHTTLGIAFYTNNEEIRVTRERTTVVTDEEFDDVVVDMTQKDTEILIGSTFFELPGDYTKRLQSIDLIDSDELNALIISLAIYDANSKLIEDIKGMNIINAGQFLWLLEALRDNAISSDTRGTYLFKNENGELNFKKVDENISFNLSYTDPETLDTKMIHADTTNGVDVRFTQYNEGVMSPLDLSAADFAFFQKLIEDEIAAIQPAIEYIEETPDPIDIDEIEEKLYETTEKERAQKLGEGVATLVAFEDIMNHPNGDSETES